MLPVLPVAVLTLAGVSAWAIGRRDRFHGEMTAERHVVFETALEKVKEPEKLIKLAAAFDKAGLKAQASLLRKRAALRTLSPEVREARREAFDKGMKSTNPVAIYALAKAFEEEGATGSARELRRVADGLTGIGNAA